MRGRRRRPRFRRAAKAAGACLLLAAAALAPWAARKYAARLPLKVKALEILGEGAVPAARVQAVAGIREGDPLFGASLKRTIAALKNEPRIASAVARRSVTGDVVILVEERRAAALVNFDELYSVDAEGALLGRAGPPAAGSPDLPVLTGPWSGKKPKGELAADFREALGLLGALARGGFPERTVSELHRSARSGWVIYRVGSRVPAIIGREKFEERARRLRRVLRDFEGREKEIREIDLDFSDRAIVKLKRTA